jgi:3-hydroxyacyl-[acyl-carrier-protein] dehydratase
MRAIREFAIDADHPALPGHFPGDPLVPGSLILDLVISAQPLLRERPMHIESVKFRAPLRPAQRVAVEYRESAPGRLSFTCRVEGALVCGGRIALADPP